MCKPVGGIDTEVPLSYFASFSELLVFCGHWVPQKDKDTSITASRKDEQCEKQHNQGEKYF